MAQVQIDNGAFAGDPTAETVYSAFAKVNANAVTIDAEQVVQDGLIADNAVQIAVIDNQIVGLGVGLNDVNSDLQANIIQTGLNTAAIAANLNMTYAFTQELLITNVPTAYRTLAIVNEGSAIGHQDYEYRLSVILESDQVDQLYYIRYRIDAGAWTEVKKLSGPIGTQEVITLWRGASPLTNNTSFESEIRKDVTAAGAMTVIEANISIVQMN